MPDAVGPDTYRHLLSGHSVGSTECCPRCISCGELIRPRGFLTVYAYRLAGEREFVTARLYCRGCEGRAVISPTLGALDLLLAARLARFRGQFVLGQISLLEEVPMNVGDEEYRDHA